MEKLSRASPRAERGQEAGQVQPEAGCCGCCLSLRRIQHILQGQRHLVCRSPQPTRTQPTSPAHNHPHPSVGTGTGLGGFAGPFPFDGTRRCATGACLVWLTVCEWLKNYRCWTLASCSAVQPKILAVNFGDRTLCRELIWNMQPCVGLNQQTAG